ncbi:ABC transporter permease [Streptomyces sp. NPDC058440]|uniref:ABC transporter permease n=1 Tax=Streptomyces sp. NPDC058440 TaxID=3346501 RepID=UPI003656426E
MLRTALRNVLAHKARLSMTALAVMLGVAFVAGTLVFGDTSVQALRAASGKSLKGISVSVQAESEYHFDDKTDDRRSTALTADVADKVRAVPGVASVRPVVNGNATLAAKDGRPVNDDHTWQNLATNYVPDDGHGDRDSRYPLHSGRGPASAGEIALDGRTAKEADYRVGDTVRFATDGPARTAKLVGIVNTDDPRVSAGGTLVVFDTRTAQRFLLRPGQFDELAVRATPGTAESQLADRIGEVLPRGKGVTASSAAHLADEQAKETAESTKWLTQMLLVFAGVALFVGVFIIANTFTMLVAQRSRETALLRAVGATRRQVVRVVLVEAALLGIGSSAAGFAVGLGIAAVLQPLLNASGADLPDGPLVVSASTVLWSLVVGVGVTVLAAWLPIRKAAKIAPVEAMSSIDQAPRGRSLVRRNAFGGLLAGAGVLTLLFVSTLDNGDPSNVAVAMLGSALTLTGVIVLAPLLSRPLARAAGALTSRFFGATGKLARENALRNPRRTAATASALMIGLTLITGMTVIGYSTNAALREETVQGLSADYKVSNPSYNGIDRELGEKVAEVPGVAAAAPVASSYLNVLGEFTSVTGADPERLGKVVALRFSSGSLADVGPGRIALSEQLAKKTGLAKGDTFRTTEGPDGGPARQLTVVGVYRKTKAVDNALGAMGDVLPGKGGKLDSILVKATSGHSPHLDQDIRKALGNSPLFQVQYQEQLIAAESGPIGSMLNMMYGLLGMTVVIGVLGVINTLAMSVFERTREIGLLRAVGLDDKGVRQMVRLEAVVISLFGAVLGIGTGVFVAWASSSLVSSSLATYRTLLPWDRLGLFLLAGPVIGVLAAIWPARRAASMNMLRSISAQ